jgi:hypothetical protein
MTVLDPSANLNLAIRDLDEGATVYLSPGTFNGPLDITKSLTLRATGPGVIIRSRGDCSVFVNHPVELEIEGITFRRGASYAGFGGLISVIEKGRVTLRGVTLEEGQSDQGPGAVLCRRGELVFDRCVLRRNRGLNPEAIRVQSTARIVLRDSVVIGEGTPKPLIFLHGASTALVERTTLVQPGGVAMELLGTDFLGYGRVEIVSSVINGRVASNGEVVERDSAHDVAVDESGRPVGRSDVGPTPGIALGAS